MPVTVTAVVLATMFNTPAPMCMPDITIHSLEETKVVLREVGTLGVSYTNGKECDVYAYPVALEHEINHCYGIHHE